MPGGQSGHPLSPHFGDQQRAWIDGTPLPLLPGEPVHYLDTHAVAAVATGRPLLDRSIADARRCEQILR